MKLLVIRSTQNISGTETYNINLLRELQKDPSIEVEFLTNLEIFARELKKNSTVAHVEPWLPVEVGTKKQLLVVIFCAPLFIPRYIVKIKALEASKRFDVVCLQSRSEMIFLTPILKLMGYKVVWIQHGPFFTSQASDVIKQLYKIASQLVDKIIVPSKDTKLDLQRGHVEEDLVKVIRIGLDMKVFYPLILYEKMAIRKDLGLEKKAFVIGYLGTLTKEKGIEDFAKVGELLGNIDYKYIVIGDGPDKKLMQNEISGIFTGFVLDVKKYLGAIDILLFPTHHYEATSIAILEAQAMGLPVLANDIGGTREIIEDGYNGYLYRLGDIEAMVQDVKTLSKNKAERELMGQRARQTILEKFNIEKQAKVFATFFNGL